MKLQPNRNYISNDNIMTPDWLARSLVEHFKPKSIVLEPCAGSGVFLKYLPRSTKQCEISKGSDFFDFNGRVQSIITNPPFSKMRAFLIHSMKISEDVYFIMTINHLWTKARIRDIKEHHFGIREILIFDTPKDFPQMGFQFGMVHLRKYYKGYIRFNDITTTELKGR